ncbi:hypothetical protein BB559_002601 [Furculomyces boomerangus]|uniref:ABC transporter domain-containing protein n=1 Tax=Furculomyces boomerangus TaxID=61424 RepID=A0A2T9YU17_9FUNG|nr:hypothetical protein BB559_002601 [Furculomyces boomerangus]
MNTLEFKEISYSVKIGKGKNTQYKEILTNMSGTLKGGEIVAIIGSSGAGKTSLLNIISGRVHSGTVTGEINFNGQKRKPKTFRKQAAYVEQDDILFPNLTVKETLDYAAQFRLPESQYSRKDKADRVAEIIKELRLEKTQDTFIGDEKVKGISGGERKRVSIGIELATDPKVLILDEPTSGLDSNSSEMVISLVRDITKEKNIISVCTIHQPSSKIFDLFDKVILMVPGGFVYFGPTKHAVPYFETLGLERPKDENPANFFMDCMTVNTKDENSQAESIKRIDMLKNRWTNYTREHGYLYISPESGSPETSIYYQNHSDLEKKSFSENFLEANEVSWGSNWSTELFNLLRRAWIRQKRDKPVLISYLANAIVATLLTGFIFFKKVDGILAVQNKVGLLFNVCLNMVFPVALPMLSVFFNEKRIMTRERSSGTYRMSTYFLSVVISKSPIVLFPNLIIITGIYFLGHLQRTFVKYIIYVAIYFSSAMCSLGFAFAITSLSSSLEVASILTPLILPTFAIYGAGLQNNNSYKSPCDMTPINMLLDTASFLTGIVPTQASIIDDSTAIHVFSNQHSVMGRDPLVRRSGVG